MLSLDAPMVPLHSGAPSLQKFSHHMQTFAKTLPVPSLLIVNTNCLARSHPDV